MSSDPGLSTHSENDFPASSKEERVPERIGQYRISRVIGRGGFGIVYLGHDDKLGRPVAIKVPNRITESSEALHAYVKEARAVAQLDHPNIVPVYELGSETDHPCYIVSKYIDGLDLAAKQQQSPLSHEEAVRIIGTIAEALHHAHKLGIFHRDIKPANILIDRAGTPYVLDFGLALREEERGQGSRSAGTPLYMSPEQARGEGHRVDGRSDIFSLGIVLYELVTGERPFRGTTTEEIHDQILNVEPRPPRSIDERIPREIDRICLRALARRASDRYSTAGDFAEDLRHWLHPLTADPRVASSPTEQFPVATVRNETTDAFISYAKPDREKALQLCYLLEEKGVRCWMAPRDVLPGDDYRTAIVKAIDATRVVLLLLSTHANESVHVASEIDRAVTKRKRVVPVRLADIRPGASLELHMSSAQWVDAWNISPRELVSTLLRVFRANTTDAPAIPSEHQSQQSVPSLASDDDEVLIDPKGPRSFDESDAGYFLRLLPGPRDREGLPEGARSWKIRIESQVANRTFSVGVLYGPSGCGKTSRVKAGLLPRLAKTVVPIYVESAVDDTESRLLGELHRKIPDLPEGIDLIEAMTEIRRGRYLPAGRKLTVFLDQFEQWLHSHKPEDNAVLVQALRQCDGARLQCVIMIRADFWLAVSRFMQALEIKIVEGENARLIDLFDLKHAREVLILFGQAMERLPIARERISKEQHLFLDGAIQGLAQEGKVVPVRLSLFAEMVRDKEWTPATLKSVGGIEGIGVTFLEEKFTSRNALPQYRQHHEAVQKVLRSLLPTEGTDIKGHMRSVHELLEVSDYANEPKQFEELIRILDNELRLITPTDPEVVKSGGAASTGTKPKCYQLTHDYLVPSLRDWLNRKKKETRQGRAELLLEDYAHVWNARRENRHLPSLGQWIQILRYVSLRRCSDMQRRMMRRASRYHLKRIAIVLVLLISLTYGGLHFRSRLKAEALRDRIAVARTADVGLIIKDIGQYRASLDPLLREALAEATEQNDPRKRLNISLALLPEDPEQVDYLYSRLLEAEPNSVVVLVGALEPHRETLKQRLWEVADDPKSETQIHLRAAAALAKYDGSSPAWNRLSNRVVQELVRESPVHLGSWLQLFQPVKNKLLKPLMDTLKVPLRDPIQMGVDPNKEIYTIAALQTNDLVAAERAAKRNIASELILNYGKEDPNVLTQALLNSDENEFPKFLAALKDHSEAGLSYLLAEIRLKLDDFPDPDAKENAAKRMANAGVYLLLLNNPEAIWGLLKLSPDQRSGDDPRIRSYLISRVGRFGVSPSVLVNQLGQERDVTIRRALVQALGAFPDDALTAAQREKLAPTIQQLFLDELDPGLHSSAEWLLREWKRDDWLRKKISDWSGDPTQTTKRDRITASFANFLQRPAPQWFINSQGQTMIAIPGGIEFTMGSPEDELGRLKSEKQQRKRIRRSFAVSSKLTTVAQFDQFDKGAHSKNLPLDFRAPDKPVVRVTWFQVAEYCNWLSKQEGIPPEQWCYRTDMKGRVIGVEDNCLERTGYRLPTDAEVEYANRATTKTCRYFGETEDLLGDYAWYQKNSGEITHPVGTRKPNDFGLFDMQGNAFTWCHDRVADRLLDEEDASVAEPKIDESQKRVLRGGAFYFMAISLRAARRHDDVPTMQGLYYSFRVARTLKK